jgi:hypothetical protein
VDLELAGDVDALEGLPVIVGLEDGAGAAVEVGDASGRYSLLGEDGSIASDSMPSRPVSLSDTQSISGIQRFFTSQR